MISRRVYPALSLYVDYNMCSTMDKMLFKFIWRGKDRAVGGSVPCSRVSPLSWTLGQERSKGDCWGERKKGENSLKNVIELFLFLFLLTSFFTFSFILI